MVAFLSDQDLRTNSGAFVNFFGLPAWTVTLPVRMALRTRAKLSFNIMVRQGKGFKMILRGPLHLPRTGDDEADVLAWTQQWTRWLEEEIRKYPEQWSWIHPRWKTTPERPRKQWDPRLKKDGD